jgi:RpiB/LacA/LacB family sugar-phosphate isomerase
VRHLLAGGHTDIAEFGPGDGERADYPDPALAVASGVVASVESPTLGVLMCGTGIGVSIAANKVVGVRAALVHDPVTARLAAEHNGANVLCLGARLLAEPYALELVDTWLAARFEARHQQRLDKIAAIERNRSETKDS